MYPLSDDYSQKTVEWLVREYLKHRAPMYTKKSTTERTAEVVLRFFGPLTLGEICQPYVLRSLCMEYNERRGTAKATVTKHLRVLQAALRWAWRQSWIPGLPVMWLPGNAPARDRTLSAEEMEALFKAAESYPTPPHIRTYIYLTLCTDQYRDAILGLTWKRVNFEQNTILFEGERGRERVEMSPRLRKALEKAWEEKPKGCEYVVHWRGKPVNVPYGGLQSFFDQFGFKDITVHDMRRSREPKAA